MRKRSFLLFLLLILSGCSKYPAIMLDAIIEQGQTNTEEYELPIHVTEKQHWDFDKSIQKIAEFEGISMYGIQNEDDETKVLICWNDKQILLDWMYLTPQGFALDPFCFDIDHDGEDELIVTIHVGTGTGVAVDQLHVLDYDSDLDEIVAYLLPKENCLAQIQSMFSAKVNNQKNAILISAAGEHLTVPYESAESLGAVGVLGNVVTNAVENDKIRLTYGIGVTKEDSAMALEYVASLNIEVLFSDGIFQLTNFNLQPIE